MAPRDADNRRNQRSKEDGGEQFHGSQPMQRDDCPGARRFTIECFMQIARFVGNAFSLGGVELGSQIAHSLGVELGTLPDHRGDVGLTGLRPGGRGARTPPAGDGARKI
jgi:hypothetical protein